MRLLAYVIIFASLVSCRSTTIETTPVQAKEESVNFGKAWRVMGEAHRITFVLGLREGMNAAGCEIILILPRWEDCNEAVKRSIVHWKQNSITMNFPDAEVVKDVMTELYADPSNSLIPMGEVFLIAVAKIRGSSPETIGYLLTAARKYAYSSQKSFRASFYDMIAKEIYGEGVIK